MAPALSLLLLLIFSTCFHSAPQVLALAPGSENDFTYMKSVYDATDPRLKKQYDYIVVGGGTAGCPLAATLSQKYSVLVLEHGGTPKAHPNVLKLSGFFANLMEEDDGTTPAQRFTSEEGVEFVRGRVLGGSSMINAGFYSRGNKEYFAVSGIDWDMEAVEKAYEWVEETMVHRPRLSEWQSAVVEALLDTGFNPNNDFLLKHKIGTKVSGSTFDHAGRRHGAAELLNKANLENLHIVVEAAVEKIIFSTKDSKPTATGVIFTDSKGNSHQAHINENGEVILSAGAMGSPQILLLSGIGPESYLSSLDIPVILPQDNVGKFMCDIPRNNINLVVPFPTEPSSIQVVGINREYFIEAVSTTLPISTATSPFSFYPKGSTADLSITSLFHKPSVPLSNGVLWLASSTGVKATPRVRFNYFSDPLDLSLCVSAMRKIGDMLQTKSMEPFKYKDSKGNEGFFFYGPSLPANQSDDSLMEEFCRSTVTTFWHYHGGCQVGKVVDSDFRVFGTNSLRVVDGSTLVVSPGTNPHATLMMTGRYLGLKMMREKTECRTRAGAGTCDV